MDDFRKRLCFSSPTTNDSTIDHFLKHETQDLIVFFGADKIGNVILLCINQVYNFKQSNSFIFFRDHTGLQFISKETVNGSFEFSGWKTPSLQFQCVVPMQTWRIVFSGQMRNNENFHHVQFRFLWKPFGFPVYCNTDNTFIKEKINIENLGTNERTPTSGYDQFGQISGVMDVDGKTQTINIDVIKCRRWNMAKDGFTFLGITNKSICLVQKLKRTNCCGHLKTDLEHNVLTSTDIFYSDEEENNPNIIVYYNTFYLNATLKCQSPVILLNNVSINTVFESDFKGVFLCFSDALKSDLKKIHKPTVEKNFTDLVLNLEADMCTYSDIVGNKARSLFRLKKAIANSLITNATVPDGICVTTIAMKNHINENKDLLNVLNETIQIAMESDFKLLSDRCEGLKNQWRSSKMSAELLKAITKFVHESNVYAVRSSGTFEDGESTSSAGQYTTVLDCHSGDVAAAVLECWSSNYSAQALTYRRNNGQPLMCDMAVIIQNQVHGQVAGIAFTRDPNTGDPNKITIAANYGSGEGVVSGSIEPDTVVISRNFSTTTDNDNDNSAEQKSENVSEKDNDNGAAKSRCTSDKLLKKLADLCIQVENVFGSPQDVEWAATEDLVHLLQTRSITSIFAWSDEEITREFDTPFTSDDVVMFYNVKEVYPNPMYPLSLTLDFFSAYPSFQLAETEVTDIYRNKQLCYTHFNLCLNVCQMFQDLDPDSVFVKIIEYSIAGKSFLTNDVWKKILLKNRTSAIKKFTKLFTTLREVFFLESRLSDVQKSISSVNIDDSGKALDLWQNIYKAIDVLEKAYVCHVASSSNNIVTHTLLAVLSLNFDKDSTPESLTNLAAMVNTPDIINVSILKDIQGISDVIVEMPSKKEFCDLPVENCYDWLKLNCKKSYGLVNAFIKKYGHRGVQELDFGSETWSTDPNRLFAYLQLLVSFSDHQSPANAPPDLSIAVFEGGYIKKTVFDFLMKWYRESITRREQSKDMLVRITHTLRMSYRKLGEKLVQEEKIPDSKLIFYMSQYELESICHKNNPDIVHKSLKRRKLWPTLSALQFDDMYCGPPVPANVSGEVVEIDDSAQLKGCCVFPGRVKNRACVLDRIEDAGHLRPDDVLIVKSVDIAWSPYFPIISGLVTEIGGVISHGAVVAREYGIPCLVGVQNAKKYFKTGDTVILDSGKGFISKENTTKD